MSKMKKIIWIPIAVVAVIAVAVLTLSLIKVNPIEDYFGACSRARAELWMDGSQYPGKVDDGIDLTEKTVKDGLNSSGFSVMQAILEGKFSYKPSISVKRNADGEKEPVTVTSSAIRSYVQDEGGYMIKLFYDDTQTIKVDGKSIEYDQMILLINESNGEVRDMICIPYCYDCANNASFDKDYERDENGNIIGHIGHDYYEAYALTVKMNTSRFMNLLKAYLG